MSTRSALVVWGGWDGHEPKAVGELFQEMLAAEGFDVTLSDSLDSFADADFLAALSLIVPVWTMADINGEYVKNVWNAVADAGVGIAGCHGGMCDSFRTSTDWQFITGSQFVAHPGNDGTPYVLNVNSNNPHPITEGLGDFSVSSEQYYLHVDPGVNVLYTTDLPNPAAPGPHVGNPSKMPQIYTKSFGAGRVFYNALGHSRAILEGPECRELNRRGFLWAAK